VAEKPVVQKKVFETFLPGTGLSVSDIPAVRSTTILEVENGEKIQLESKIIIKEINGKKFKMYGFNGQIPGPTLKVKQGSTIFVEYKNNIDLDTTVHWHGLRLENENDGVPNVTQPPMKPGDTFLYKLDFPDEGIYWYHPHVREDIEQDSGLYGNILVVPSYADYYNPVNKEVTLVLDDILIEDGKIVPYGKEHANYVIMGRFGNVMLTNGETFYKLYVEKGEVVRFYITDTANVRPYNLSFDGAKIKLIGDDVSSYERETFVDSIVIAPAERYVIEVLFDEAREYKIMHTHPDKTYNLGVVEVLSQEVEEDYSTEFNVLRRNIHVIEDIDNYRKYFNKPVDYQLDLTVEIPSMIMIGRHVHDQGKIEWEDEMGIVNAESTSEDVTWILKDKATNKKNKEINWNFKVGDIIKIRLFNEPKSKHPMQHPIHFHGQRFLVLEKDDEKYDNLAWTDTVLVPTGSSVDILLEVSNPGTWMAHCHISEHLEAGMMFNFNVT